MVKKLNLVLKKKERTVFVRFTVSPNVGDD